MGGGYDEIDDRSKIIYISEHAKIIDKINEIYIDALNSKNGYKYIGNEEGIDIILYERIKKQKY